MRILLMAAATLMAGAAVAQTQPVRPIDEPFRDPGRNVVVWDQSPHFNMRANNVMPDTIVLHHTASSALPGVVRWFRMPESRVSAHFTIGKDGSIVQHVSTYYRAWHAGSGRDAFGRGDLNSWSVGIEIVNKGDGSEEYTEEQLMAVEHICSVLMRRFPIKQIISHEFLATPPGRKNDPINFPWERMKRFGVPLYFGLPPFEPTPDKPVPPTMLP